MQHDSQQAESIKDQEVEQDISKQASNGAGEQTVAADAAKVEDNATGNPGTQENPADRIAALEARVAELQNAVLYTKAEGENIRRRAQDDVAAAHKYSVGKFASELLIVKDCLEMALKDNSSIENIKIGVDMTLRNLSSAFEKFQVKEIDPKSGDKLDPNRHQAMSAVEADAEPNTVVSVMQKGYLLADRVLRPAMVVVAKLKAPETTNEA